VRATERSLLGAVVLTERFVEPDPAEAARLLAADWRRRGLGEEDELVVRRSRFAGLELDVEALLQAACEGHTRRPDVSLIDLLPHAVRRELDRLAPPMLEVPSGRRTTLEYRDDGTVLASVKLQELFGLAESPRLGPRGEPVVFALLAPNGRPVQTTRDLASFWHTTYAEVRKELRGRYPRHPWPEDPWTATPTARITRRS
jgi:ATP-dependent helicase HrpB